MQVEGLHSIIKGALFNPINGAPKSWAIHSFSEQDMTLFIQMGYDNLQAHQLVQTALQPERTENET